MTARASAIARPVYLSVCVREIGCDASASHARGRP